MRFEEAIKLLENTQLHIHPTYAEAFALVKSYAFNYYMSSRSESASVTTPRDGLGGLLTYNKEIDIN